MLNEILNNPEKLRKYIKWETKRFKRLTEDQQRQIAQKLIERHTEQYINLTGELPDWDN